MITWFIGMSGSGKSTLAYALYQRLKPDCRHLIIVDGDDFRKIFQNDTDHSVAGRQINAERISNFCLNLDQQGVHVIAAVLSIFPEWQQWNRQNFSRYHQVFLDIPMEELIRRDTKGLYEGASEGRIKNVVGFDIAFPTPIGSDCVIDLEIQQKGFDACLTHILGGMPSLD